MPHLQFLAASDLKKDSNAQTSMLKLEHEASMLVLGQLINKQKNAGRGGGHMRTSSVAPVSKQVLDVY